jgi:hypothetical protein
MTNFDFINDIYTILTKDITMSEILLNMTFIIIIFIISYIFYWDILNKQVINNSKCKNNLKIMNSDRNFYYVNAKDDNNTYLYNIKYDMLSKKPSVDCKCPVGDIQNNFENIKIFDKTKPDGTKNVIKSKYCYCDKKYDFDTLNNDNIYYTGNQFLVDYMETNNVLSLDKTYFNDTDRNINTPKFPSQLS